MQLKSPDRLRKEAAVVAVAQLLEAGDAGEGAAASNTVGEPMVGWAITLSTHSLNPPTTHTHSNHNHAQGSIRALIDKLLAGGAVQLLMERMFDTSSGVRLHAAGALRCVTFRVLLDTLWMRDKLNGRGCNTIYLLLLNGP